MSNNTEPLDTPLTADQVVPAGMPKKHHKTTAAQFTKRNLFIYGAIATIACCIGLVIGIAIGQNRNDHDDFRPGMIQNFDGNGQFGGPNNRQYENFNNQGGNSFSQDQTQTN